MGHVIECGTQTTGGIFTDWRDTAAGWSDMGFPIAECDADGAFVLTKPEGTGGLVSSATVAEQIVYEVGDPSAYLLPDVCCDWSEVRLEAAGENRVRVSGARGRAPSSTYKVCATFADGYRASTTMMIAGREAADKAEAVGRAVLSAGEPSRCSQAGFDDFSETSLETLGAETTYGGSSRARGAREVILKIGVRHTSSDALKIFGREIFPAATAMAQGLTGFAGGRPEPQPVFRPSSFLIDKAEVPVSVRCDGMAIVAPAPVPTSSPSRATAGRGLEPTVQRTARPRAADRRRAWPQWRQGRHRQYRRHRPPAGIRVGLAQRPDGRTRSATISPIMSMGPVERFDWPGLDGFNFLLHRALGGGGVASLRHDPQGKALAQALMDFPLPVPASWLEPGGLLEEWTETLPVQTSPDMALR